MTRARLGQFTCALSVLALATTLAAKAAFAGEILEVIVSPNPIIIKGSQLGASDIAVMGRGTCHHVVIYITLPEDPPPSGGAWVAEKTDVVFNGDPAKTGTVAFGNVSFSMFGTYKRIVWAYPAPVWAYPAPRSRDYCKGRAKTVVTVNKSP